MAQLFRERFVQLAAPFTGRSSAGAWRRAKKHADELNSRLFPTQLAVNFVSCIAIQRVRVFHQSTQTRTTNRLRKNTAYEASDQLSVKKMNIDDTQAPAHMHHSEQLYQS